MTYEYSVLCAQFGKATFLNDRWLGTEPIGQTVPENRLLESCPTILEELNRLGAQGWDLVATSEKVVAIGERSTNQTLFYLKRYKLGE